MFGNEVIELVSKQFSSSGYQFITVYDVHFLMMYLRDLLVGLEQLPFS